MTAPDGLPPDTPDLAGPEAEVSVGFAAGGWLRGIPCAPGFAEAVAELARRRGVRPRELATAALLLVGSANAELDPGPGTARLDIAPPVGTDAATVRRALSLALALAEGKRPLREADHLETRLESLEYRNTALKRALERLAFQPLQGGISDVREAARLFGFVNEWCFDEAALMKRFRELAPVYHPDTGIVACRERMAQLIEARNLLLDHVRTAYAAGRWHQAR